LEAFALRVSALESCLLLVQEMAHRGHLRAVKRSVARTPAKTLREKRPTQCRDSGLPVRKDYRRVGGEQRGYDGGKKVRGRKRHLLVDTEGLVLKAKIHSAKVPDQEGLKLLLKAARDRLPRLSHLWVDAGYQGRGKEWAEQELGLSVEVVHRRPKPMPEKIAMIWAEEWAKEGREIDWQKLFPRRGFEVLARRWVVERTFAWLGQNRRMSKDYERLCATGEAFIYAAMSRLMVRRLVRV
jgi:putative transposase